MLDAVDSSDLSSTTTFESTTQIDFTSTNRDYSPVQIRAHLGGMRICICSHVIERIRSELRKIWIDPPPFCRPGASPVTDLLHWEVVIDGPDDSPYVGGTFPVDVDLAGNYPFNPPKITFKTKVTSAIFIWIQFIVFISLLYNQFHDLLPCHWHLCFYPQVYHPNINSDGVMTLSLLRDWSAATTIQEILIFIVYVLSDPMFDVGYRTNDEVNDVYESDIELYEQLAMAWTWEYSSAPIVSHYPTEEDERRLNHLAAVAHRRAADEEEERRRCYEEAERRRCQENKEELERRAAASLAARERMLELPRVTWKRVVAFLQGWSVALPFATSRRRFSSTVLPLSNYTGRACFYRSETKFMSCV